MKVVALIGCSTSFNGSVAEYMPILRAAGGMFPNK